MSENNSSSNASSSYDVSDDPLYLCPSDQPNLQLFNYTFNGRNFLKWKRDAYLALIDKNKDGFVDGTCKVPPKTDCKYHQWIKCDLLVMKWLLNIIDEDICDTLEYVNSSKELWTEVLERYGQTNGHDLLAIPRNNMPLVEYYRELKQHWENVNSIYPLPLCTCGAVNECSCKFLKLILDRYSHAKLIQFLLGLDSTFEGVTTNVLSMETKIGVVNSFVQLYKVFSENPLPTNSSNNAADDSEKRISSQISDDYRHTFLILNTIYKCIQPKEKRIFFLLACLSPLGSSASIESLMRYGIGLNLFQHENKLSKSMELAVKWANELILSSLLLEGDVKADVKIHDVVRAFAISYAAKEEHRFVVETLPRWFDDETLGKYTAISLTSKNDYSRLSGVDAYKLQILILKGDLSPNFDDFFFNGMVNLEVLALSNMNFQPRLPESMRKLKKLRTLCMEGCQLGNIELIGELVNLLVLSLRESLLEQLPTEVGNLCRLRLLDLSECTSSMSPLIPTSVLSKLSSVEGLYLYNNRQWVFETQSNYEVANVTENYRLPYLNILEIKVRVVEELPIDGQFIKKLDKFRISVENSNSTASNSTGETPQKNGCILNLGSIDDLGEVARRSCLKVLLKKAEFLKITSSYKFEDLAPQLDQEGFKSLRSLGLFWCKDIKCIVDGRKMNNLVAAFPYLQSLNLSGLKSLEKVVDGDVSQWTFLNLQTIILFSLNKLQYGLPLVPRNVNEILVTSCKMLKFMFIEDEVLAIKLPFLKTLKLSDVPGLLSFVGPKKFFTTYDQGPQCFFDAKIVLPSLERFILISCGNVLKLWSNKIYTFGFQNLKEIQITLCGKLSCVGSPSVFSVLVQLETLSINRCQEMRYVISVEERRESEINEQTIRFPQLKLLELKDLSSLESFYEGGFKLEFPKLEKLILEELGSMKRFAKLGNSSALFNKKIDFPCLKELRVINVNVEVMGLWDEQSLSVTPNPAPMLKQLALGSLARLRQSPSLVLENLFSLTLVHFQDYDALFPSSDIRMENGFVSIYSQMPNLEELRVEGSQSLKELFEQEDYNATNFALTLFCRHVKTLELYTLPFLNNIPLHLFKSIASLTLSELKWNYLISADVLTGSLHQLQFLSIEKCNYMEALVINVGSRIKLPRLKHLRLLHLPFLTGISSTPEVEANLLLPSLESLVIDHCDKLGHFWAGSILAPRLHDVSLYHCRKLQQFLVPNPEDTVELPSLQKLSIRSCHIFNSISSGSLTEPGHVGDLQLPSLEIVEIASCPDLRTFSLRSVLAPKCTRIRYEEKEYSVPPLDDLNHFLQRINDFSSS